MSEITLTPSQRKTRNALLNAGLALILTNGYDNITVTDITNHADYGRSTFYLYFKDKEDMAWQLLKHQSDQLDQLLRDSTKHLTSPQREWAAWKLMFETVDYQREFFNRLDGKLSEPLRRVQKQYLIQMFQRNLESGFFRVGIDLPHDIAALFLVGTTVEIMEYWVRHPERGTAEDMAGMVFQIVFHQTPQSITNDLSISSL